MIPPELEKPIDEIKTPSNRILVICLISAISVMGSVIFYSSKGSSKNLQNELTSCQNELKECRNDIKILNQLRYDDAVKDALREREKTAKLDSIINAVKKLSK